MGDKTLTIFIGKYVSLVTVDHSVVKDLTDQIRATAYPIGALKVIINRLFGNNIINVPIGKLDENIPSYNTYAYNPFQNKVSGQRVKVVLADPCGTKNLEIAEKLKFGEDLLSNSTEIKNLQLERDMLFQQLTKVLVALDGLNIQGIQDKNLLMALEVAKESKKKLYSTYSIYDMKKGEM